MGKKCKCGKVKNANFGYEKDKKRICCVKCKDDDMINLKNKIKCKCGKSQPNFGYEKDKRRICCSKCKDDDMINLNKKKLCKCNTAIPSFGLSTDTIPSCCSKCKSPEMIDIIHKKCVCGEARPSFGYEIDNKAICCTKCKTYDMIDIINKRCVCGLSTGPCYGYITDNKHICCSKCKEDDMIDLKHTRCHCGKNTANFGEINDDKPKYCSLCKTDTMIDLNKLTCKANEKGILCSTWGNKKYNGYCCTCFANLFPLDPLTLQIRNKTKEIAIRNFLTENYIGFIHDKPLWINGCDCTSKRRIDHRMLIDNTLLCIETDENQHKYYNKNDEIIRYDDLMMIHGGKFIYIRFNPDKYRKKTGKIVNPTITRRCDKLSQEIDKQIIRIKNNENTELLEIIYLYYDNYTDE